jgi:hypothetical protein
MPFVTPHAYSKEAMLSDTENVNMNCFFDHSCAKSMYQALHPE